MNKIPLMLNVQWLLENDPFIYPYYITNLSDALNVDDEHRHYVDCYCLFHFLLERKRRRKKNCPIMREELFNGGEENSWRYCM